MPITMDAESKNICAACAMPKCPRWPRRSALLGSIEFAQQKTLVPELDRLFKTITSLQKEFWDAMRQPKASRRPALAKEYMDTTNGLLETLDKLSGALAADVNHQDAVIDQLLAIKQIAWLLRNTAGEASLIVSMGLAAGRVAPEAKSNYTKFVGGTDAAWKALELIASGMQLPPAIANAIATTKTAYFEPQYLRFARAPAPRAAGRREAGIDGEPVDPAHGRSPRRRRRRRRSRARCRQRPHRGAVFRGAAVADHAARAARRRHCLDRRRLVDGHPPRHHAAAQYARRDVEGRRRRAVS